MISLRDVVTGFCNRDPLAEVWRRNLRGGGGGSAVITGVPPLRYIGDGRPLTDYMLYGNTLQDGTPSPDAPVDAVGCGVRTAQLIEGTFGGSIGPTGGIASSEQYDVYYAKVTAGATYAISGGYYVYAYYSNIPSVGTANSVDNTRHFTSQGNVITAIDGASWIGVRADRGNKPMLNLGSTALPYEPYGHKLPLTVNGVEYPIYLGQVQSTRRIKKLVLTGTSSDGNSNITQHGIIYITPTVALKSVGAAYCTHFKYVNQSQGPDMPSSSFTTSGGAGISLWFKTDYITVGDFKTYLASQYANGTPVTVWYVLATPETAIVNEPLMKIGDYADTISFAQAGVAIPTVNGENVLDVPTEVPPSEITIKGGISSV